MKPLLGLPALALAAFASVAAAQEPDLSTVFAIGDTPFPRSQSVATMIGQDVVSLEGDKVAVVTDVILDEGKHLVGYVVDAGGFLGIDGTSAFVPADKMTLRIDGVAVEFVLSMDSASFRTDVKLD